MVHSIKIKTDYPPSPWRQCKYMMEAVAVYIAYAFFALLPIPLASGLGGWVLSTVGPRTRLSNVARQNLARAFPEKSEAEKEKILRGMWENLGRVIGECPHLHRIARYIEVVGGENIAAALRGERGALMFSAHLANWEIPVIPKNNGHGLHIVYRKPNNPWVDGLLRHARRAGCVSQIEKGRHGARAIASVLRSGGVIGMLMDQKLNEGVPIPFFGHDAMTASAIAHFALKFKCPIYPCRAERLAGCRFRVTVLPPLKIAQTEDEGRDVKRILTEINGIVEVWIRERPEQWLWIHRRWPKAATDSGTTS